MRVRIAALSIVLLGGFVSPALARGPQRFAQQRWQDYSPRQRYDALQNYKRHEHLPEKRREDIERNYQRWRSLPEQERNRIRRNYHRFQEMPPAERQRLERRHQNNADK